MNILIVPFHKNEKILSFSRSTHMLSLQEKNVPRWYKTILYNLLIIKLSMYNLKFEYRGIGCS